MTTLPQPADPRGLLTELYWAAVTAAAPGPALRAALEADPPEVGRPVHLIALGKAALPMAETAVRVLAEHGAAPAGGILVVPEPSASPHPFLTVALGDHPQPGPNSFAAAEQLGEAVAAVPPDHDVWVLLSGGTTSLIGAPLPGLRPADLTELYRLLLGSGLDITAMNRIRKRFARWAGGRLAAALYPAHVKNFTISDVIGDDLESIGSGPCVPDSSNGKQVRAALEYANLWSVVPPGLREHLDAVIQGTAPETPKAHDPLFQNTRTILIASNHLALEAAVIRARDLGVEAQILDTALAGEAAVVGRRLASELLEYDATKQARAQDRTVNKDTVFVWGGETTVTLAGTPGRGGRSQELALAAAEVFGGSAGASRITLLAAGTDGRDGPTDAAGGFADHATWQAIQAAGRDPSRDLRTHHGYDALQAGSALFKTGMTGTNVMDVVLGLVRV